MLVRCIVHTFIQIPQSSRTNVCINMDILSQGTPVCNPWACGWIWCIYVLCFRLLMSIKTDFNSFALETWSNPYACASVFMWETQAYKSSFINDKLCPLHMFHSLPLLPLIPHFPNLIFQMLSFHLLLNATDKVKWH